MRARQRKQEHTRSYPREALARIGMKTQAQSIILSAQNLQGAASVVKKLFLIWIVLFPDRLSQRSTVGRAFELRERRAYPQGLAE
jgi:hypothetical protein